jgi:Tfp pilus assembly protein PilN
LSALFNINFRREAYLKEVARARRRLVTLGVWVAYFGVVAVAMGLYGLNCMSLSRRVTQLQRQTASMQKNQTSRAQWQIPATEVGRIETYLANPRQWQDRMTRLVALLPDNAKVTSVASNPNNQTGPGSQDRLVVTGQLRVPAHQDRMAGVTNFVSTLRRDSLFASTYKNVRLSSTRIVEANTTEFVIECQ